MAKAYIRIWQEQEIEEVRQRLVIAGDLAGDCANCRQIGIDYKTAKECPNCRAVFKYIASRSPSVSGGLVHRIKQTRPDLIFIDFSDFKKATGKDKARELFK